MTETLLINFLFLLLPVLFYLIFYENRSYIKKNKKLVILFSAITIILCMSFPIKLEVGFIFDLRYIPFIIASLFGGYRVALPLYIVINIYRLYIGGDGVLPSFLFSTLVFFIVPYWTKNFINLISHKRIIVAGLVSLATMKSYLIILGQFFESINKEFVIITINVLLIHVLGTIIIMALIEKIIENTKARKRYLDSDRLHVISELAASISHEIRNPLTVTNGFLQLLNESNYIQKTEKRYIGFSLQELKRAEGIVSNFLSLAKPQAENMVSSNLEEEFNYVNSIMTPYATIHQVTIDYFFSNKSVIRFDKNQLQQCLINLYKNGIESMQNKGGILSVEVESSKDSILIQIKDTGIGMTKDEISRIGKPYYSTKEEGTGLGMIVIYSTINKLNGKIEVESEKGKGTNFLITIPFTTK
ncbi:ATP-binding protein [Fredinandcohnia sp. 179-A 10B2 NHS]|uniref:ATP-binding protein n=1 Tax=Fredinandcohnia sp. 179-A 10B2 NHS TaxID=3235176 RepID=UPI0039A28F82